MSNSSSSSSSSTSTCDYGEELDTLQCLLQQEARYYTKQDFRASQMTAMKEVQGQYPAQKLDPIDSSCRTKMCAWFQQICNFCQYDDDEAFVIIENALSYLDRYVVTPKGSVALLDRNYYQGTAITCLYMATKIHAHAAISSSDMSQITRFVYTTEQIEEMEYHILQSLNWHVNPPTVSVFVAEYMKLLIQQLVQSQAVHATDDASVVSMLQAVKELVHTNTMTAFGNETFIAVPASVMAYTAIVNAVQMLVPRPEFHGPLTAIRALIVTTVKQDVDKWNGPRLSSVLPFAAVPVLSSPTMVQTKYFASAVVVSPTSTTAAAAAITIS